MAVPSVNNKVVVTPIFWAPSGFSFTASYKSVINGYLANLAADSGKTTNVFASITQYPGSNGTITYGIQAAPAITDTDAFPATGCVVNSGPVYSDSSGYSVCLDDAQLQPRSARHHRGRPGPRPRPHLRRSSPPRASSRASSPGNPIGQAVHDQPDPERGVLRLSQLLRRAGTPSVYANMPFPIYQSATGSRAPTRRSAAASSPRTGTSTPTSRSAR